MKDYIIFPIFIVGLLIGSLLSLNNSNILDKCQMNRYKNIEKHNEIIDSIFSFVCSINAHFIVELFKMVFSDLNCNIKSNSISGHFSYHSFWIFSLPYLIFSFQKFHPFTNFRSKFLTKTSLIFYIIFLAHSIISLSRTYFGGFHSLRQVIYGLINGIIWHSIFVLLFKQISTQKSKATNLKRTFKIFIILLILTLILFSFLVVFSQKALSILDLIAFGVVLFLIFFSFFILMILGKKNEKKEN
ncbi:hypothetical protein M0811_07330 [Anaeramoeba ignava]|uniref:Phosphatidic acid phosphatase type 2/haloperoxidase domain-containing protein n=1 Tax=Anaeramoeba ignava TaxID=1746090 RepID=A0A9Q0LP59_ANAIG|nr:hypothetical protein M0811_07330 [Anaeramoeba ignava]